MKTKITFLLFPFFLTLFSLASANAQDCDIELVEVKNCVQLEWTRGPYVNQESRLKVAFSPLGTGARSLELTAAKIWMPHHGHGSSPVRIVSHGSGEFLIEDIYFVMPGLWEFRFTVSDGSQKISFKEDMRL